MNLTFQSDTKHRKQFFTGVSFSHPAKMLLPLELWLIENYSKPGDVILDPMSGSGTILVACSMGRDVICVELEQKFIEIIKGNWQKIQERGPQLGYQMGKAKIIQGDARKLEGLLCDVVVTSPPYANQVIGGKSGIDWSKGKGGRDKSKEPAYNPESNFPTNYLEYSADPSNIGNLPYGKIDQIITSPPYTTDLKKDRAWMEKHYQGIGRNPKGHTVDQYCPPDAPNQIGNLKYGSIDAVISSPPYEGSVSDGKESPLAGGNEERFGRWKKGTARNVSYSKDEPCKVDVVISSPPYEGSGLSGEHSKAVVNLNQQVVSRNRPAKIAPGQKARQIRYADQIEDNLGNLKGTSYLEAMLQVYQQCFKVLKAGGVLCLVTKNYIRNKTIVDLAADTIKLCETAGFTFQERHYRKLTSQSFWRVIYKQKYPDAPEINTEDILIFRKALSL